MTNKTKIELLTNAIYLLSIGCEKYVKEEVEKIFYADKNGRIFIEPKKKRWWGRKRARIFYRAGEKNE